MFHRSSEGSAEVERAIIHVDMDAFYAAVEERDRPELRGQPVIVGADPRGRGVVSTASYAARKYGIHSAMPISEAYRRCPHGVYLPVDGAKYSRVSTEIMELLEEFSPLVEPLSLDEAFLDVTGTEHLLGPPLDVARRIKTRIREATQLTASVGVASNKFLAKIASDFKKPDGLVFVEPGREAEFLAPLPIRQMWGVGKLSEMDLRRMGIETIGQLARTPRELLARQLGTVGEDLWVLAHGFDDRPVTPWRAPKSIGAEETFPRDHLDMDLLGRTLLGQAERVARECREAQVRCRTVTLKLRFSDFKTVSRSQTLQVPTDQTREIYREVQQLLRHASTGQPVRLIGVSVSNLVSDIAPLQLNLFKLRDKDERVSRAVDLVQAKFGRGAIVRATLLGSESDGNPRRPIGGDFGR